MSAFLLLAQFIPVTSITLPNKHKGPHKSDLQRFISLEGRAHQLSPVKMIKTYFFIQSKFSMTLWAACCWVLRCQKLLRASRRDALCSWTWTLGCPGHSHPLLPPSFWVLVTDLTHMFTTYRLMTNNETPWGSTKVSAENSTWGGTPTCTSKD